MTPTEIEAASNVDLLDRLENLRMIVSPLSDVFTNDIKQKAIAERIQVREQILARMDAYSCGPRS